MAVSATRVTVDTTAGGTEIVTAAVTGGGTRVNLRNRGSVAVYIGADGVTTSTGYQLDAGESVGFLMEDGESVYGITGSSSAAVHVLKGGG
jgi:hypothetical protein